MQSFIYIIVQNMYIKVKVRAGAKRNVLISKRPDSYEITVKAPAERGLANEAVRALLASHLGINPKKLRLIKGAASPAKIFEII
jgi:uncharacterized protein YggU (UPF0235/DUF167 family)